MKIFLFVSNKFKNKSVIYALCGCGDARMYAVNMIDRTKSFEAHSRSEVRAEVRKRKRWET